MSPDEGDLTFVETTPTDDVIEGHSRRPPKRWTMRPWWLGALVLAVLAAGIGIGYALGRHTPQAAPATSTPIPAGSLLGEVPQLSATTRVCSVQPTGKHQLQLGIQVQNGGGAPLQLTDVQGVFPTGELRMVAAAVGQCNVAGVPVAGHWVTAGATAWLRLTVDVHMRCPAPDPVQFQVDYIGGGPPASVTLPGFPDLGNVRYSGCQ